MASTTLDSSHGPSTVGGRSHIWNRILSGLQYRSIRVGGLLFPIGYFTNEKEAGGWRRTTSAKSLPSFD